jgi:4'-phosphopantetheinyl transferase
VTPPAFGWLARAAADVPPGDAWLHGAEASVQARLRVPKRRDDWRLGRWTAKRAVAAVLGCAPEEVAILAAADGAPEAFVGGRPAGVALSLSHRGGFAVAAVAPVSTRVGIDLEVVEPRSEAFVDEWYAASEQALVARTPPAQRPLVANTVWTAKEAAAKVLREGLRLNVRQVVVSLGPSDGTAARGTWHPCTVDLPDERIHAWWRHDGDLVVSVATDPPSGPPEALDP